MLLYRSTGYEKRVRSCLTSYPFSVATCLTDVKLVCCQYVLIGGCLLEDPAVFQPQGSTVVDHRVVDIAEAVGSAHGHRVFQLSFQLSHVHPMPSAPPL